MNVLDGTVLGERFSAAFPFAASFDKKQAKGQPGS